MMDFRRLTVARGFNRIFIVLAVVWAIYCLLVYPLQRRNALIDFYEEQGAACYEAPNHDYIQDCVKMWSNGAEKAGSQWNLVHYYKTNWEFLLPVITIFPAIAYGLCRFITFVFQWIYRGFSQPA
jgi:hypothetical protein